MKHVGMNVAADCFVNSAITGVKGRIDRDSSRRSPVCTPRRMNKTAVSTETSL